MQVRLQIVNGAMAQQSHYLKRFVGFAMRFRAVLVGHMAEKAKESVLGRESDVPSERTLGV